MKAKAKIINIDQNFQEAIETAKEIFLNGGIFIYPTDTIYGFGANPFNEEAVQKIGKVKNRDDWKRYIFLIHSVDLLRNYIELKSENHLDFLLSIWPNPVSAILKLNAKTQAILQSETGAFRIPNHRFCQKLLAELKMPLVSTSVNRSNNPPLTEPSLIIDEFSYEVDAIIYTESKSYFEASTLIDLSDEEPKLIREGKFKFEDLIKKMA